VTALARIARLSAAFVCSNLARASIGVGLALVLGRALGVERFGAWVLCTTWASTLTVVVDLGLGVLLTRDGARADADPLRLVTGALALRLAAALPMAVTLVAAAGWLSSDPETIAGLRVAALVGFAGAAYGCFGALLRSQPHWLSTVLGIETAYLAGQVAASWWLVEAGRGIVALVTLAACVQLVQIATALALWRPVFGTPQRMTRAVGPLGPSATFWTSAWALLVRALPFALSGIVANLETRVAPLMLGALAAPAELGWFGAASRVGRAAKLAPQAIFAGALPVLSHEYGRDHAEARRVSRVLDRALAALSASMAAACALAAPLVMRAAFGPGFVAGAPALVWVAVGLVPALSNSGRKVFLYAAGGEAIVVRWSAAAVALQIVSGALLIPAFGAVGAAIGVAIGEIAVWWPLRRAEPASVRAQDAGDVRDGEYVGAAFRRSSS
jgi:O-antigen/teichoic acid export membrane protein